MTVLVAVNAAVCIGKILANRSIQGQSKHQHSLQQFLSCRRKKALGAMVIGSGLGIARGATGFRSS